METSNGTVSAHLDGNVLEMVKKIAAEEDRSISWVVGFAVKQLIHERVKKQDAAAGTQRQVQLEDAIVAAVKRGPSKPAKHK
jgi:predicted transcriptional regulator